jgi:MYXO-CTERM domain-containing protein
MHRSLNYVLRGLFALSLLAPAAMLTAAPVAAAARPAATIAATTSCSNGVDNTGGLGLICQITIVNTITGTGGSATVTVHECHGAAGDPTAACTTTTHSLTEPVTAVTQCNNSINGGGGTLRCSVVVTNNFVGVTPGATAATVNQCVGSGGGITVGCDPFPATTSGAAITQCNGSANGGTLVGLTCTATGTMSSAGAVTINQCNGSANGGGALVICSASLANNAVAPSQSASLPPTSTAGSGPTSDSTPPWPLIGLWMLAGLLTVAAARRRGTAS